MNCPENEYVCSVKKENNLGFYRLHTIWTEDGFVLNVTSKDGAWRGELTSNDVKTISSQLDMEPSSYLRQCKETLTTHDGYPGITYSVENGSFTWKKIVDEDSGIKIKMGSVMLKPASFVDTIQNLVQVALDCNKKMQEKIKKLNAENHRNMSDKHSLLKKLNQLIETKETMESDLYSRFILLLNSKKKKIMELETALEESKGNSGNVSTSKEAAELYEKSLYEADTENDDCDLEVKLAEKKCRKSRVKSDKSLTVRKKARRKNSFLPGGSKKTKILGTDYESGDDILDFSNDSPPGKIFQLESSFAESKSEIPAGNIFQLGDSFVESKSEILPGRYFQPESSFVESKSEIPPGKITQVDSSFVESTSGIPSGKTTQVESSFVESKSEMPCTRDELLKFFYGES